MENVKFVTERTLQIVNLDKQDIRICDPGQDGFYIVEFAGSFTGFSAGESFWGATYHRWGLWTFASKPDYCQYAVIDDEGGNSGPGIEGGPFWNPDPDFGVKGGSVVLSIHDLNLPHNIKTSGKGVLVVKALYGSM